MKLEGAVALVTGASHGIGWATASSLHEHGTAVGLVARSVDELQEASRALGPRSAVAIADVTDKAQVDRAFAELEDQLGPPDILVNNAGIGAYASMLEEDPAVYERLMRVNYLGTVHAILAVLPGMASRRRGHFVNIASVAGRLGAPFEAAYSASKFAVVGLSESLAAEVQMLGIRVSLINPGPVKTRFAETRGVPFQRRVPRPVEPERIAAAVIEAIERDRFEQTIPKWLRSGSIARAIAPDLYRRGLLRDAAKGANALARRLENRTP
ncbi:MAG: SDR family NAD(P)-dependent oxidoreductase [Acidimicrobiales bacterium]